MKLTNAQLAKEVRHALNSLNGIWLSEEQYQTLLENIDTASAGTLCEDNHSLIEVAIWQKDYII